MVILSLQWNFWPDDANFSGLAGTEQVKSNGVNKGLSFSFKSHIDNSEHFIVILPLFDNSGGKMDGV